jgi:hypothetical protein
MSWPWGACLVWCFWRILCNLWWILIAYVQCGLIVIRLENVHSTWRCNGTSCCVIFNHVNFMSLKYWWLKLTYLRVCVWLEEILKKIDYLIIVVSHSQNFTNGVCSNIIPTKHEQLKFYIGNCDQYVLLDNNVIGRKSNEAMLIGTRTFFCKERHCQLQMWF